jgi:quinol monooxygenase YgiN
MSSVADSYGLHVAFTAQPGKGEELAGLLLLAAKGALEAEECSLYMVSRSPTDPDAVYVTEAWNSKEAHDAGLETDGAKELIAQAMPLMAAPPEATQLRPLGGKGA